MTAAMPLLTLALLGAFHGLNPGMGWLFAVALGLQERSRAAVYRAFAPIALGHALSVAVVVALVASARALFTPESLRLASGLALVAFGLYKLLSTTHPRWVGMRVNGRDLTAWSFLMATAHGAGLMLVPVLLQLPVAAAADHSAHAGHAAHIMAMSGAGAVPLSDLFAVLFHTAVMFAVMGVVAVVVYEKLGTAILRRVWFNVDRLWAFALVGAGLLTFVL